MCWADRVAILIVLICASIVLMANLAHSEDWVDSRTYMHFGASAAIGAGSKALIDQTELSRTEKNVAAFAVCMIPGVLKEVALDERASTPDLVWDAVGCASGIALWNGVMFTIREDQFRVWWRY